MLLRQITGRRNDILRTGIPRGLAIYEDWLPHADFHILSLFSRQYFDYLNIGTNDEIIEFFKVINDRFDQLYKQLVRKLGIFLNKREKERGYSHPRYFKTELSWQEIQVAIGRRQPIKLSLQTGA